MKPKLILLFTLFVIGFNSQSQSLSPERVKHIKESTARVTIEGSNGIGSGFFIDNQGTLITCWHVIKDAIFDENGNMYPTFKRIFIVLNSGEKILYGLPTVWLNKEYNAGVAFDFCPLIPVTPTGRIFPFLKVNLSPKYEEGDEIYTCGYPLAIPQQFITKGFISNKYIDSVNLLVGSFAVKKPINLILMDMTMNRGNSGGAIVKIGNTPVDDEVIGIADFIINPIGSQSDDVIKTLNKNSGGVLIGEVDPLKVLSGLTSLLSSTTNGISGAISISHLLTSIENLRK